MPTNTRISRDFDSEINILAGDHPKASRMLTLDLDCLQFDAEGRKRIEPGYAFVELSTGLGRVLPLTRLTTAAATGSPNLVVSNAVIFKAGDVLVVPRAYARADLGGTYANTETLSTTVGSRTVTTVRTASESSLTLLAAKHATEINADPVAGAMVQALAETQSVHLFCKSDVSLNVGVAETAASGTYTLDGSVTRMQEGVSVGTISSINVNTRTLVLASNSAVRLPVGAPVGVLTSKEAVKGINLAAMTLLYNNDRDMGSGNDVPCYEDAVVYGSRLAVWDGWLQSALPKIVLF